MAGELRAVLAYLRDTLLPSIDGTTVTMPNDPSDVRSFTFDLSGTGRVVLSRPPANGPELLSGGEPVVYIFPASPTVRVAAAPPGHFSAYAMEIRVGVIGFVAPRDAAGEGDTAAGRYLRAADLLTDLVNAILADRGLGGNALDTTPEMQIFHGGRINAQAYGIVEGLITISTVRT